jgi:DNA-directed RNA polymerase specialized sigma24 family protein
LLDTLPEHEHEHEREAVRLRVLEDLEYSDIARALARHPPPRGFASTAG